MLYNIKHCSGKNGVIMVKDKDIFDEKRRKRHTWWKKFKENNFFMNYTVMLVPHSEKKPRQLRMPAGVIMLFLCVCFTLLCLTTYWAYSAYCLKLVEAENAGLKKISAQQEKQIEDLDDLASKMLMRLDLVSESEDAVREKVGLSPSLEGVGGVPSESFTEQPVTANYREPGDLSLQLQLKALDKKLEAVDELLQDEEENVDVLTQEVDARLLYLNSVPDSWPISGARYTSAFGSRNDPFGDSDYEQHSGIDLACEYGTPVYAAGQGAVFTATYMESWGNVVMIDHGFGYRTVYAHLSMIDTSVGERVQKGDLIGYAGSSGRSTGTHLHFSLEYNGEFIDPLDLLPYTDDIMDLN